MDSLIIIDHRLFRNIAFFAVLAVLTPIWVNAQLPRERARSDRPIDYIFPATTNVGISTVTNLPARNLSSTVLHTFGLVDGGINRFYGLDDGANTRIGVDYGISDRLSMGLGRMTFNKVVDIRGKYKILRQTVTGSTPVDMVVKVSTGINTTPGTGLDFSDRSTYFMSLMIARKTGKMGLQLSPMVAHFNQVIADNPNQLYGLGMLTTYELNERYSLSAEYLPVIGDRNEGTHDAMAVALNVDTGGHVFQLFFTSSQWHNEQFIMANNRDRFWKGDFRFGFNIHRVFGLGR